MGLASDIYPLSAGDRFWIGSKNSYCPKRPKVGDQWLNYPAFIYDVHTEQKKIFLFWKRTIVVGITVEWIGYDDNEIVKGHWF